MNAIATIWKTVVLLLLLVLTVSIAVSGQRADHPVFRNDVTDSIRFCNAGTDQWYTPDKFKHLTVSFFIFTTMYYYSRYLFQKNIRNSNTISFAVGISLGLGKEIRDGLRKDSGAFSYKDLIMDVLGLTVATIMVNNI